MRATWLLACGVAVLVACSSDTAGPDDIPQAAVRLDATDVVTLNTVWSGHDAPARTVINSGDTWAEVWDRIHQGMTPKPAVPAVDFGSSSIVLVALGTRPTSGYRVDITETRVQNGVLYVRVVEQSPGPTCGTHQALTAPVHAVQIPKQTGPVYFISQRQTLTC